MTVRSKNAVKNSAIGLIASFVAILASFGSRLLFTHYLEAKYLGYNGLFSSIISVLSIAELGISSAITYRLYKPIKENDQSRVHTLLTVYKKFYFYIACFMIIAGIVVSSFIQIFIKEGVSNLPELRVLFLLYLLNTVISYFFAHKRSMLFALQFNRIIQSVESVTKVLALATQWFVLIRTHSFVAFLIINCCYTFLSGCLISHSCDQHFDAGKISIFEKTDPVIKTSIFSDIKNVFLIRISGVAVQSTDNLIISAFISNFLVGLYSNYQLVITSVNTLALAVIEGAIAPLGDMLNNETRKLSFPVVKTFCFVTCILASFCSVEMITMLRKFILIFFGSEYLMDNSVVYLAVAAFFIHLNREPLYDLINLTGSFRYYSRLAILEAVLNVVLDLIFAVKFGIAGVLAATVICRIFGMSLQLYICYSKIVDTQFGKWYLKNLACFALITVVMTVGCTWLLNTINTACNFLYLLLDFLIVAVLFIAVILILYYRQPEFQMVKRYLTRRKA